MTFAYNLRTQESEAGLQIQAQPGVLDEMLTFNKY
jgi:hypothetical protein